MPRMPELRVVPLELIRRHEEVDPLRVVRLRERIEAERIQANPMVCIETSGADLVLLDGATRTEALRAMGLAHAVVQVVDTDTVSLGTWHHVVRDVAVDDFIAAVEAPSELELVTEEWPPTIHLNDGRRFHARGVGISPNATLAHLVKTYVGRWQINRVSEPEPSHAARTYDDWAALVEFPTLTVEDVMDAAIGRDLLPAGVTRFLVPERALRLNLPLDLLQGDVGIVKRQSALDALLEKRAREGRVRRYAEPVFILDD